MERAENAALELEEPKYEKAGPMTIVGLSRRYGYMDIGGIPAQWTQFQAYEGTLGERPGLWYGVCDGFSESEGTFRYTCGVAVDDPHEVTTELETITLPAKAYLAFTHRSHISELRHTMNAIWSDYLPRSAHEPDGNAPMFELYDEKFDPRTGQGGIEIWIPLKR